MYPAITLTEIRRIFEVLDRLEISREDVVIPLRPVHPGEVRRTAAGKIEILIDGEMAFDDWLAGLEARLRSA